MPLDTGSCLFDFQVWCAWFPLDSFSTHSNLTGKWRWQFTPKDDRKGQGRAILLLKHLEECSGWSCMQNAILFYCLLERGLDLQLRGIIICLAWPRMILFPPPEHWHKLPHLGMLFGSGWCLWRHLMIETGKQKHLCSRKNVFCWTLKYKLNFKKKPRRWLIG